MIGIIILARVESNRLDKKVLEKISGRTAIEILIERLQQPKYEVVLAIPDTKENDILEKIAFERGIRVYRGQNNSPLHRFYNCAIEFDFEHAVRITDDDIFIDTWLMYDQIYRHMQVESDYTFMKQCPEGVAGEVIKISALEKVVKEVGNKNIEYFHYYFRNKNFKVYEFIPPQAYRFNFRLTLDYEEDLFLIRILYLFLQEPFSTLDLINFLKKNKFLLNINRLPEITVYTCNYNTSKFITQTFDSVFRQDFNNFEYIILDDHSGDESSDVILEYYSRQPYYNRKKMNLFRNIENRGLTWSSNFILEKARGKYIVRVDSDDIIKPNFLSSMIETIKLNGCQAVVSGFEEIDENGKYIKTIHDNPFHAGCSFLNKKIVNDMKYREDIVFMEGQEFFDRFNKEFKIYKLDEILWQYRRRSGQKSQENNHPNKRSN